MALDSKIPEGPLAGLKVVQGKCVVNSATL